MILISDRDVMQPLKLQEMWPLYLKNKYIVIPCYYLETMYMPNMPRVVRAFSNTTCYSLLFNDTKRRRKDMSFVYHELEDTNAVINMTTANEMFATLLLCKPGDTCIRNMYDNMHEHLKTIDNMWVPYAFAQAYRTLYKSGAPAFFEGAAFDRMNKEGNFQHVLEMLLINGRPGSVDALIRGLSFNCVRLMLDMMDEEGSGQWYVSEGLCRSIGQILTNPNRTCPYTREFADRLRKYTVDYLDEAHDELMELTPFQPRFEVKHDRAVFTAAAELRYYTDPLKNHMLKAKMMYLMGGEGDHEC